MIIFIKQTKNETHSIHTFWKFYRVVAAATATATVAIAIAVAPYFLWAWKVEIVCVVNIYISSVVNMQNVICRVAWRM